MPEQIFTIPLTNGTSVPAQDIVHSWDLWSFFSEEDTKNPTPITASLVLLGGAVVASFALFNVFFIVLFMKYLTKNKNGLRELPQEPCPSSTEYTNDDENYNHLNVEMKNSEKSLSPLTHVQIV